MHLTFDDVAVCFSEEEWRNLSQSQQELYEEVMKENYANLLCLGLDIETPAMFNQIELWEMTGTSKKRKNSRLPSHTESGVPNERQTHMQVIAVCETPGQKIKLKDCQPKCLKCKGVYNCYCRFARGNSDKLFVCLDCGKRYGHESYLLVHQRSHYRRQPHKCSFCEKSFKKPSHLMKHQKTHQVIEYKCSKCQVVFQTAKDLKEHKAVHQKPNLCTKCGEKFNLLQELKLHRKEAHPELLECTLCHQRFHYKTALVNHQREHFRNEAKDLKEHKAVHQKTNLCTKCGEKFNLLQELKLHREEAHPELLECTLCHQRFNYKTALVNHQREHFRNEVYKCHKCEKVYIRLPYLLRHVEVHYKDKGGDGNLRPKSPPVKLEAADCHSSAHTQDIPFPNHDGDIEIRWLEEASPYVIPLDPIFAVDSTKNQGQKIKRKERLAVKHLKESLSIKPFKCKKCKKYYRHRSTLMRHRLSHSLVFRCRNCGQKFGKMLKFFMHRNKHERRRPYKCNLCGKTFSFQSLLHLHQHTHNSFKPGHGGAKCCKTSHLSSKETSPNTRRFTSPTSLPQHQKSHRIKATKDPSDDYSHDVRNIRISPDSPNKILGKRPYQEIACKEYVKRVCYTSCESGYTM